MTLGELADLKLISGNAAIAQCPKQQPNVLLERPVPDAVVRIIIHLPISSGTPGQ